MKAKRMSGKRQRRPVSGPGRLPGEPYSKEWLDAALALGICDGYVIIDDTRAGMLFNPGPLDELAASLEQTYGVRPREIVTAQGER